MKKKFLALVCFIYTGIILYVKVAGSLKNYLAPNMQNYLIWSAVPILILGVSLLYGDNHYKFKVSDLILILPVVMLILSGDGKLTTSLAKARTSNLKKESVVEKNTDRIQELDLSSYDMSVIDFDITDEVYNTVVDYLNYETNAIDLRGNTIRIKGFVLKNDKSIPDGYFAIGRYAISCCAADSYFLSMMAKYSDMSKIKNGGWYELVGVIDLGKDKAGSDTMFINVVDVKKIKAINDYIYPCYYYGDGSCSALDDFDLKY